MLSAVESIFFIICLQETIKVVFLHSPKRRNFFEENDPVVQLVRMPPCHGGGRGFESRPDRKKALHFEGSFFMSSYENQSVYLV